MKYVIALTVAAVLVVMCSDMAVAQEGPTTMVRLFKERLDAGDINGMLSLYWDPEVEAPLQPENAPRLVEKMEKFIELWKDLNFDLEKVTLIKNLEFVFYMYNAPTRQQIKFYTVKSGTLWYIKDTEFYFNVAGIGEVGGPLGQD